MSNLIIQSVGEKVVSSHNGNKLSTHRPETLNGRYEMARSFIGLFGLDVPISIEAIDKWAKENGHYEEPDNCTADTASGRRWLVDQRQKLKKDLNYGGKSTAFDIREQFQLKVLKQGKTWIAKSNLLDQAVKAPDVIGRAMERDASRGLQEAQRLITSLAANGMSKRQEEVAGDVLNSIMLLNSITVLIANDASERTKNLIDRFKSIEHKADPALSLLEYQEAPTAEAGADGSMKEAKEQATS